MKLWIDTETRSSVPIKQGNAKYATDVEVMTVQWAVDDGVPVVEDLTASEPSKALIAAAEKADEIWAHSAEFDRTVLETTSWWPVVPWEKWRCTAALARMHGLPGGLDKLSVIFKLPVDEAKDKRGKELIQLFCVPTKDELVKYNDRHSHPAEWKQFLAYGLQDIPAMRAVYKATPKWNATPRMWAFWHLDQRMNARGVAMDLKLCQGAVDSTTRAKQRLRNKTTDMTLGVVESTTQRNRLLAYLEDYGVSLPDLTADTVERRLNDEALPEHVKELLRIRQQASKASTAKYKRALNQHVGGRLRNLLVFCGAMRTGRWAGRTLQPQNLPRPKHKPWEIEQAIVAFREDAADLYDPEDILGLASSCLRGMIVAEPGNRLVISDLANIEGRFMAWIAGEAWKLEAFAAYDRKEGPDLYKLSYARAFNIDPEDIADEGDFRRQIGKVMELALQYYGGVGAFCSMAETYHLDLDALAAAAWDVIPAETKLEAHRLWLKAQKRRRTYGLEERVWVVCQSLVLLWRAAHPAICKFWKDLEEATHAATHTPGKVKKVGRLSIDRHGNWLRVLLPSGRYLSYPAPREGEFDSSYLGIDPYTKQWKRISTYSGKRAENIVQGGCADILMDGLLAADEAGYNPVLSVHDEGICEPKDEDKYHDKALSKLLVESSLWADGLPLAAKGKTLYRYSK
jgi:DNA polymerase